MDSWHGVATLALLPFFIIGLVRSSSLVKKISVKALFSSFEKTEFKTTYGIGRILLLFSALGIFLAGLTIMIVGMTTIFVPQDLEYMNITVCGIEQINKNLKPLIAHDRAAFGGGLATIGLLYFFIIKNAAPVINLWQILFVSMAIGFSSAIGVHFIIGYTNVSHLLPACLGAASGAGGLILTYPRMRNHAETSIKS